MTHDIPAQLDWVNARANCSITDVFLHLRKDIARDIETRNGLTPVGIAPCMFRILEPDSDRDNEFTVIRDAAGGPRTVRVHYTATTIVLGEIQATLTLNAAGRCVMVVDGQELESWQVRRLAFEGLFFS
jgi:hypothetical protein